MTDPNFYETKAHFWGPCKMISYGWIVPWMSIKRRKPFMQNPRTITHVSNKSQNQDGEATICQWIIAYCQLLDLYDYGTISTQDCYHYWLLNYT